MSDIIRRIALTEDTYRIWKMIPTRERSTFVQQMLIEKEPEIQEAHKSRNQ